MTYIYVVGSERVKGYVTFHRKKVLHKTSTSQIRYIFYLIFDVDVPRFHVTKIFHKTVTKTIC